MNPSSWRLAGLGVLAVGERASGGRERADLDMENQIRWVVRGRGVHGGLLLREEVRRSKERGRGERAGGRAHLLGFPSVAAVTGGAEEGEGRDRKSVV